MRTRRSVLTVATIGAVLALTGGTALAQGPACLPGLQQVITNGPHAATYTLLRQALQPRVPLLTALLAATVDQTTYDTLLTASMNAANAIPNGRLVVALPDGTVAVDTSKNNNTYANFQAKAINENHNSRVSFITAQMWQCGIGAESKLSSSTGLRQTGLALRLTNGVADHLDSEGTARLSQEQ